MDNNFEKVPENTQPVYTDPNADVVPEPEGPADIGAGTYEKAQEDARSQADAGTQGQSCNEEPYSQDNQYEQHKSDQNNYGQYQGTQNSQYGQYQSGQNNQYGQYQSGQNNPYGQYQSGQNNPYGQYQSGQNNPYGQYQSGQNNPYGQYQNGRNEYRYENYQYAQDHQLQYQNENAPLSMGEWVLTILAGMIPCAGIVLYLVWAFSSNGNVNRRNFCRAQLVIMAVIFVLYLLLFLVFAVGMMGTAAGM